MFSGSSSFDGFVKNFLSASDISGVSAFTSCPFVVPSEASSRAADPTAPS